MTSIPAAAAEEAAQTSPAPGKPRKLLYVTLPGCWGGLIFACLSFTPSLLPRGGLIQGIICGITAAIGYGLGVLAASIWRAFPDREPRQPRRWAWTVFFIAGPVLFLAAFGLGQYWQYEIRKLMGVTDYSIPLVVAAPFVAALVFCLFLLIGRGLRGLYRWLAKLLTRWIGRRAAHGIGWVLVVGLTYLVVSGLLLQGFVNLMNNAYGLRDTKTAEGIHQPTTSLRSGGPGSLIPWDSLGWQGRNFIGKGPSVSDLAKFSGHPAMAPIRIYAGLASANGPDAQAALAVRDLQRAGGFQRKNLVVVTTTGSGWVDPALVDSVEYLSNGDCATVAIQYSYLPSWVSYLVDQSKALAAGQALFDAIYGAWVKLPAATARSCTWRGRAWARSAARPRSPAKTIWPTAPAARCSSGRLTSIPCSVSSVTIVTRAVRRSSPSTRTAGSSGSVTTRARASRRPASRGTAAGSC